MADNECPVCGLDEDEWDHEECEEAQQVEPYSPEEDPR
jgi:hypothetical protein